MVKPDKHRAVAFRILLRHSEEFFVQVYNYPTPLLARVSPFENGVLRLARKSIRFSIPWSMLPSHRVEEVKNPFAKSNETIAR
jgi:hypothetical protein